MHESESWKWSHSVVSDSSDPMDCSLPGSSVHGIFQARVLEWGAIAFSIFVFLKAIKYLPCAVSKRHSKSWIRPHILYYIKAAFLSSAAASLTNRLCVNTSFQLAHDWGQGEHRSLKFKNNPSKLFFAICCVKIPCPNCLSSPVDVSGFTPFPSFLEQRFRPTPKWPNLDNTGEAEEAAEEQREFNYIHERLSNWVFGTTIWVCESLRTGMRRMKTGGQACV